MNLAQLGALIERHGATATAAQVTSQQANDAATIAEAMGQRMMLAPQGFDYEGLAAECTCGLVLAELPRPVTVSRVILVLGKPRTVRHPMTHAHVAPGVCVECYDQQEPCPGHPAMMCDTPEPELCDECGQAPAPLGGTTCRPCIATQERGGWDPDRYYGTD